MIKKGSPILISRQDLLDYVSEEEIAFKYVHGFSKVDKSFKSEFRAEDIPSSRLFWGKHGYLMFKDFGDPNIPEALSMIQYVAHKYQIDEQAAVNKIAQDFGLIGGSSELNIVGKRNKVKKVKQNSPSDLIIKIKRRDFQQHDIEYWNQFGISLDILNKNNVKAISHLFYGNSPPIEFSKNHLVYSLDYYVHEGIFRRKIYQPLSLTDKWKSNCDFSIVQHYNRTPKEGGDLFSLNDTNDGFGSAKRLSEERARIIEQYLLRQGIPADRMQVKAWGGKRPIYEKNSNQAQSNVRVEIEILED